MGWEYRASWLKSLFCWEIDHATWSLRDSGLYSTRWCPPSYKLVISPLTIDISPINHSEIGVMFTNLAIDRGHHLPCGQGMKPGPFEKWSLVIWQSYGKLPFSSMIYHDLPIKYGVFVGLVLSSLFRPETGFHQKIGSTDQGILGVPFSRQAPVGSRMNGESTRKKNGWIEQCSKPLLVDWCWLLKGVINMCVFQNMKGTFTINEVFEGTTEVLNTCQLGCFHYCRLKR